MSLQTTTVVLEGPTGEERTINNVNSITTEKDGTILINKKEECIEMGWDWTIREVKSNTPDVDEDDYVMFLNSEYQLQEGKIVDIDGEEVQIKTLPDGWMTHVHKSDIIKNNSN